MEKVEIKKEYPKLYQATTKRITKLDIPMIKYIAIDGVGNPTVSEFKNKSKLLFTINKALKEEYAKIGISFSGSKLEGIWDTYDNEHFDVTRKKMIKYTLMMPQPNVLNEEILENVKKIVLAKNANYFTLDVYLKEFKEGQCVQMLHVGPYNTEINLTKQIMEYITVANLKLNGFHHEIYLNKPDRVAPENLKTIVRYPVEEKLI